MEIIDAQEDKEEEDINRRLGKTPRKVKEGTILPRVIDISVMFKHSFTAPRVTECIFNQCQNEQRQFEVQFLRVISHWHDKNTHFYTCM
jgi:hypothetical protein